LEIRGTFMFFVCILMFALIFYLKSQQEARAYERLTGVHVSAWDAMWLELRIQEPVHSHVLPDTLR